MPDHSHIITKLSKFNKDLELSRVFITSVSPKEKAQIALKKIFV